MENIGFKPVPIQSDMRKIEQSVQKQMQMIQKKKGVSAEDTEAKDVIDKDALYNTNGTGTGTGTEAGDTSNSFLGKTIDDSRDIPEDDAKPRRAKRAGNKIGAVSKQK